jgi:hypothetical protein
MKHPQAKNTITTDFVTVSYRISCRLAVPVGGLFALLIDPLNSYLELQDVYISRVNAPGTIVAHREQAALRKDSVLFCVLTRREDGDPPKGTGFFLRPVSRPALMTLPSFEIRGQVEAEGRATPRDILVQTSNRYVPIYDATATYALNPAISFEGQLMLVNRDQLEALFMPED